MLKLDQKKNINDHFLEILQENYRLKNELNHLNFEKFYKEITEQIKNIHDKIEALEYKINNETEINNNKLSLNEMERIIRNELIKTKNEITVSDIIYRYHNCDSYEEVFRDNIPALKIKIDGIQISLDNITNNNEDDA